MDFRDGAGGGRGGRVERSGAHVAERVGLGESLHAVTAAILGAHLGHGGRVVGGVVRARPLRHLGQAGPRARGGALGQGLGL
jgi:hypothetical protein